MSTKRRANRAPACLARASLRPWVSCDAVVDQRLEPAVEVGAADLVGDEQRLADRVGGRVGELRLQHVRGCGRSRSTAATRAARPRTPAAAPRARGARPRTAPAGSTGRASEVRMRSSSSSRGQASIAAARRAARRARYDASGKVAGERRRRPARGARRRTPRRPTSAPSTRERDDDGGELTDRHVGQPGLHEPVAAPRRRRLGSPATAACRRPCQPSDDVGEEEVDARRRASSGEDAAPVTGWPLDAARASSGAEQSRGSTRPRSCERAAEPDRARCRSTRAGRRAGPVRTAAVTVNCAASAPAGQVLDRDDLGDPRPVGAAGAVHDDVDALAHERVERASAAARSACRTAGR